MMKKTGGKFLHDETGAVYYNGSYGSCNASTCYEGYTCTSASSGYYLDGGTARDCGSSYPNSLGGNIDYSYCYKNDTCRGDVVDGSKPSGCSSGRSDGSCDNGNSGTRRVYYNGRRVRGAFVCVELQDGQLVKLWPCRLPVPGN